MKNKSLTILLSLLVFGCNVATPTDITPLTSTKPIETSTTPTPLSSQSSGSVVSSSPSPSVVMPTVNPTATNTPIVEIKKAENEVKLKGGYIITPSTSFLVQKDLDLKIRVTFDKLDELERIYTIFSIYDNERSDKKSHYNLTYDKRDLILTINGSSTQKIVKIPKILKPNELYEFQIKRQNNKIDLVLNGQILSSEPFDNSDFSNEVGRRVLSVGADEKGNNRILANIDSIEVKDILSYDFTDLKDNGKYKINPIFKGEYEHIVVDKTAPVQSSVAPTATPEPTPTPSYSAMPERNVTDQFGKLSVDLKVYNPRDSQQYADCTARKKTDQDRLDSIAKANNTDPKTSSINCLQENGSFNSSDFDFGTKALLENNALGDIRFVTYVDEFGGGITKIVGNNSNPKVDVIDIGEKIYEGVDLDFLKNKVDYTNAEDIFSSVSYSSNVYLDHVYAIKTSRYGQDPRYAKIKIEELITDDYEVEKMESPTTISSPSYVLSDGSALKNNTDFTYYVSSYDGYGETIPTEIGDLPADENANDNKVVMKFKTPYNSKGFSVYRVENDSKIIKMGPYLTRAESETTFEDFGTKGTTISSLPKNNSTKRNGFKPSFSSKPKTVEFSFSFYASK